MRFVALIFLSLATASPAFAVDIINRDSVTHTVLMCTGGCDPKADLSEWITLAPGEVRANACPSDCAIVDGDEGEFDPEDILFSDGYSGGDIVVIEPNNVIRKTN